MVRIMNDPGLLLPILEIDSIAQHCLAKLIEIGYQQAGDNEEGMVDFEDAIRIFIEVNYPRLSCSSSQLLSSIIRLKHFMAWGKEFVGSKVSV